MRALLFCCIFIVVAVVAIAAARIGRNPQGDTVQKGENSETVRHVPPRLKTYVKDGKLVIPHFVCMPKVGDIGYLPRGSFVSQRLDDDNEALVLVRYKSTGASHVNREIFIRGFDFSQLVDGQDFAFEVPFVVVGIKTFKTASGERKTVHVMIPLDVVEDPGGGNNYLLGGRTFNATEITAAQTAFAKANLIGAQVEGNRIRVPSGQESVYVAAMADAGVLPSDFHLILDQTLNKISPFMPPKQREEFIKNARQRELSNIIRSMPDIDAAVVAGLKTNDVMVIDANGGDLPLDSDDWSGDGDAYITALRKFLKLIENQVFASLAYVSDVRVVVKVELMAGLTPKSVTVTVAVPTSYFEGVRNSLKEMYEGQDPPKTVPSLDSIESTEIAKIELAVAKVISSYQEDKTASTSQVQVTSFVHISPPRPADPTETKKR